MAAVSARDALREIEEVLENIMAPCELEDNLKAKFDVVRKSLNVLFLMDVGIDKLRRKADNFFYGEDEEDAKKAEEEPEGQAGAPPEEVSQGDAKRAKTAE